MTRVLRISGLRDAALLFVTSEMGVSYMDLVSKRRPAHLVAARALFVWIVKSFGPEWLSFPTIGNWLGGRDHSTIIHLFRNVAPRLRERDPDFLLLCDKFVADAARTLEIGNGNTGD
jgi:chromosomal replication initiation ATPase DnaA